MTGEVSGILAPQGFHDESVATVLAFRACPLPAQTLLPCRLARYFLSHMGMQELRLSADRISQMPGWAITSHPVRPRKLGSRYNQNVPLRYRVEAHPLAREQMLQV